MTDRDAQDAAEALDDGKLSEDVELAGEQLDYPPEHPLGVEDPTSDSRIEDSLSSREARRASSDRSAVGRVGRLVEPGAEDDGELLIDDEPDAVARSVGENEDLSAEESAMHLEDLEDEER